jgi:hypothetical protein
MVISRFGIAPPEATSEDGLVLYLRLHKMHVEDVWVYCLWISVGIMVETRPSLDLDLMGDLETWMEGFGSNRLHSKLLFHQLDAMGDYIVKVALFKIRENGQTNFHHSLTLIEVQLETTPDLYQLFRDTSARF